MKLNRFLNEAMQISAAVIITNGRYFLIVHPTYKDFWEPPKGLIDGGEDPRKAAIRETEEETGVKLHIDRLEDKGIFTLHSLKDVNLFVYKTFNLPDLKNMKCDSIAKTINAPEVDDYMYVTFNNYKKYVRPEFHKMIDGLEV